MKRRQFLKLSLGSVAAAAVARQAFAQASVKEIRIGYQKNGVLVITRERAALESHFKPIGVDVKWVEFSSGPPMMEAMNSAASTTARSAIPRRSLRRPPVPRSSMPPPSRLSTARASWCRRIRRSAPSLTSRASGVGFTKGSSAHNIVVQTLEKAGLGYTDITPVYLTPPDAGPAFGNGSIDAWAIWDPYFAIGEIKQNGRILAHAREITKTNSFFIANRDFAKNHGPVLQQIVDVTAGAAAWAETHRDEVAKSLSAITGVPLDIQTVAASRAGFSVAPLTDDIIATQQGVADRFFKLGLIPKQITIRDIVWRSTQT